MISCFLATGKQIYKCQPRINNFWLLICWVTPIRDKLLVKCLPPTKHLGAYQFGVNISHRPQFWPRSCMAIGNVEQTFPSEGNEKQRDSQHETMQKQNAIWTTHSSKKTRTGTNNLFMWAGAHFSRTWKASPLYMGFPCNCIETCYTSNMICACHPGIKCSQKWFALLLGTVQTFDSQCPLPFL